MQGDMALLADNSNVPSSTLADAEYTAPTALSTDEDKEYIEFHKNAPNYRKMDRQPRKPVEFLPDSELERDSSYYIDKLNAEMAPDPESLISVPEGAISDKSNVLEFKPLDDLGPSVTIDGKTGETEIVFVSEAQFVKFWSVDIWETINAMSGLVGINLSGLLTDDDDLEHAKTAAKSLYDLSGRITWLQWMRSEVVMNGGDMMIVATFFGGKALAVFVGWKQWREKRALKALEAPQSASKKRSNTTKSAPVAFSSEGNIDAPTTSIIVESEAAA